MRYTKRDSCKGTPYYRYTFYKEGNPNKKIYAKAMRDLLIKIYKHFCGKFLITEFKKTKYPGMLKEFIRYEKG